MRAVVCDQCGSPEVLRYGEVERPVPGPHEVLVRVFATSVNRTDVETLRGTPIFARLVTGVRRPAYRSRVAATTERVRRRCREGEWGPMAARGAVGPSRAPLL